MFKQCLRAAISIIAVFAAGIAQAQTAPTLADTRDVEAFMDGVVSTVMRQRQIPGAVLVVVHNGAVLLNKGYGYADRDKKTPVLPDRTLFRIASVSKTVNATAIMQFVERGEFDLETPAAELLAKYNAAFVIPEHYAEPIRLIDLINHTAGFDERAIGMTRAGINDVPALGDYLARRMPPQVMPPRETMSYSNHGVALSGYLVELAANQPYGSYIRDNIFGPLGMTHSAFAWAESLAPDVAQGYEVAGGAVKPVPFDHICIGPAGAMLSCGSDMARYMIAHLQKGQLDGARILNESTAIEMHRLHYKQDDRLNGGMAVGFFTGMRNGRRMLEHGGDFNGFASELFLLPDDGVGIFASCNVDDGALRSAIVRQFMDRYFPSPEPAVAQKEIPFQADAVSLAGVYRSNRYGRRSIEKLITLMAQINVRLDGDHEFVVAGASGEPVRFVQTKQGQFADPRTGSTMVFRTGADGDVTHMLLDGAAFERLKWYETSKWQLPYIAASILLLLSAVMYWPVAALRRRASSDAAPDAPAHYRVTTWFIAALSLFLLVMFAWNMLNLNEWEFAFEMPMRIALLLCIPLVLIPAAALLAWNALAVWWHGYWRVGARIHYTLVIAACIGLLPFLHFWNMLGFNW
ncbi:MAG: serine hydrolase domain-containing protein [Candidatus Hydrogenedentes bacterium]|nr:serine hydrolase domain-containing protein [Candidatus Hydrogenedentota bacterium]